MAEPSDQTLPSISINAPMSIRHLRALNPHRPIEELRVSSVRFFGLKLAREVSKWTSIRKITLWSKTSKAALRQLLTTQGLEEIYVAQLHNHGSLNEMSTASTLSSFSGFAMSSADLLNVIELQNLVTLNAQHSHLSEAIVKSLNCMKRLERLDFEGTNLNDDMALELAKSKQILSLYIGKTDVGPQGLENICQMTQLRELDIWALKLKEVDLAFLPSLTNLEYLSLGGYEGQKELTARGVLPVLAQMPSLKQLWLDGITLTGEEISTLKKRYDHVQVTCAD